MPNTGAHHDQHHSEQVVLDSAAFSIANPVHKEAILSLSSMRKASLSPPFICGDRAGIQQSVEGLAMPAYGETLIGIGIVQHQQNDRTVRILERDRFNA